MKKRKPDDTPPRPICACGGEGIYKVRIDVQELTLQRDAGISSRPYWTAEYRSGTQIETIMCQVCVKANVRVYVSASATVEGAEV